MSNHVHLLVCEKADSLDSIMKRIGVSYTGWYNRKQERVGYLFQDRYKSEPVEDETYLLSVLRYIHNNPVRGKLVLKVEEYKWSSYREYNALLYPDMIINKRFMLGIFEKNQPG